VTTLLQELLKDTVRPMLSTFGFRREGLSFRRMSALGDEALIEFQRSSGSTPDEYIFYVNVGVIFGPWRAYLVSLRPDRTPTRFSSGGAAPVTRIRLPQGGDRWPLTRADLPSGRLVRDLTDGLLDHVTELNALLDRDALSRRLAAGDFPRGHYDRRALLAALLAARGPSDDLEALLRGFQNTQAARTFVAWARAYASSQQLASE
jgi:hypothetical protein